MANRNFKPGAVAIEKGLVCLFGRVLFTSGGAIDTQDCRGFSVVKGATGKIVVTLEDQYNALYNLSAVQEDATGGVAWSVESVDVGATVPTLTIVLGFGADPADGVTVMIEITLKNSTVQY